jgi:transposase-like protein
MNMFKVVPIEVKEKILVKIKNEGITVSQAALEFGITTKTIYNWLRAKSSGAGYILEMAKLRRQNKILLELVGKFTLEKEQQTLKKK